MASRVGLVGSAHGIGQRLAKADCEILVRTDLAADHPVPAALLRGGARPVTGAGALFEQLEFPRLVFVDLPPGPLVDEVLDELSTMLEPGDVLLDSSASYWVDTLRRARRMRHRALYLVDLAIHGDRLLVAGDHAGVELARGVLEAMTGPRRLVRCGQSGAAHFSAALGDALSVAVDQARAEVRQLLEAVPLALDAAAVMTGLMPQPPATSGRAAWVLDDAVRLEAATPLLASAVMLARAEQLELHETPSALPRLGPYQDPSEIL